MGHEQGFGYCHRLRYLRTCYREKVGLTFEHEQGGGGGPVAEHRHGFGVGE